MVPRTGSTKLGDGSPRYWKSGVFTLGGVTGGTQGDPEAAGPVLLLHLVLAALVCSV